MGNRRKTTDEFVMDAKIIHGETYDYSEVKYIDSYKKIAIKCYYHGVFYQTPDKHLQKCGCPLCGRIKTANSRRKTSQWFIKEARLIHGEIYNYKSVSYKTCEDEVNIICKKHGVFKQRPNVHLKGCGCPKCGNELTAFKQTMTTDEFLQLALLIHGKKYDYSAVEYISTRQEVAIKCNEHGLFYQTPDNHLQKHGCVLCGRMRASDARRKTTEEFVQKALLIHGKKYNYSKVKYIGEDKLVTIICLKHGEFIQLAGNHLVGKGCKKCAWDNNYFRLVLTRDEFVAKALLIHGDKYDYRFVDYTGLQNKVEIVCPKHGKFKQLASNHLATKGCQVCAEESRGDRKRIGTVEFIKRAKTIHGDKYDYNKVSYGKTCHEAIDIICKKHGVFKQRPNVHLKGCGCPKCKESNGERRIRVYLDKCNIESNCQYPVRTKTGIRAEGMRYFDFYIPRYKTMIEFNGGQHYYPCDFGSSKTSKIINLYNVIRRDRDKKKWCRNNNIRLVIIPFWMIGSIENIIISVITGSKIAISPPPPIVNKNKKLRVKLLKRIIKKEKAFNALILKNKCSKSDVDKTCEYFNEV